MPTVHGPLAEPNLVHISPEVLAAMSVDTSINEFLVSKETVVLCLSGRVKEKFSFIKRLGKG